MLTGNEIAEAPEIIIKPYKKEQVQPNGYDLTIGPWFIRYKSYGRQQRKTLDLDGDVLSYAFAEPVKATRYITFRPMERILCHTQEIIGTTDKYVMQVSTRSTLARWGIDVCGSAGFGDVGFVNKWTLELQNNTGGTIAIPVGARVAQAYFEELTGREGFRYTGKYNSKGDTVDDFGGWQPTDMLPKSIVSDWIEE